MSLTAVPLPKLEPGSPEWMTKMTASKVAAVLGLSPWESRFSLWHRMAGLVEQQPDTNQTRRGHYLEDGVARWFADQHPEFTVLPGAAWAHSDRPWQAASPDRLLTEPGWVVPGTTWDEIPRALLEIKTAAYADEWGEPGTDAVPPYYRAQVVWQMDTLGIPVCYVAVLIGQGFKFAEYVVHYDADEAGYIRAEGKAFMDSLPGGPAEQRPNIDGHSETYEVVKALNPGIEPGDVEVPFPLALEFADACRDFDRAKARRAEAVNLMADHMGNAKAAVYLDGDTRIKLADRRSKNGGTPYLQAASKLPVIGAVA